MRNLFRALPKEGRVLSNKQTKGKAIVLVHSGFVDGSGWEGVYDVLKNDGYDVSIVQNPTVR